MNNEEKDIFIRSKLKNDYIPEKIDDLFNNCTKMFEERGGINMETNNQKMQKQTKENKKAWNRITLKRILATAACITIALGGGNIYAKTQGYENIFFMIRDKIISRDTNNRDEILSDKDITISYKSIEVAKGIKLQVNRLVIKDNEAKLYLQVDKTESEFDITPFTYVVSDDNRNELCNYKGEKEENLYTEELILNNYKNDTKILNLEVRKNTGEALVTLRIDLENREIEVVGNEEAIKKISEEELKKYLGAFALYNYDDKNLNAAGLEKEVLENERKLMVAKQIAKQNNIDIYTGEKKAYNSEYKRVMNTEKINNIVKSFSDLNLEEDGLMKLANVFNGKGTLNGKMRYIDQEVSKDTLPVGLCFDITDISYVSGIYNITFTYCYYTDSTKEQIEELPVYEMSVGLILNEENEYCKYYISSNTSSKIVKVPEVKVEKTELIGEWEFVKGEKNDELLELRDIYGTGIQYGNGGITFYEDGEFKYVVPGISEVGSISGTFTVENNNIKLNYNENTNIKLNVVYNKQNDVVRVNQGGEYTLIATRKSDDKNTVNTTPTTNTNNSTNVISSAPIYKVDSDIQKFFGKWQLSYAMTYRGYDEIPIANLWGDGYITTYITINEDGTFVDTRSANQYEESYYGTYTKINDTTIKRTYDDGFVVYTKYETNAFGEIVISNISLANQSVYEYYVKEVNKMKNSLAGRWARTYNVDHEENNENTLLFNSDGTFIEYAVEGFNSGSSYTERKIGEGTYKIIQEQNWDVVVLTYKNGEVHKLLYGDKGSSKVNQALHYSAGQQVYRQYYSVNSVG